MASRPLGFFGMRFWPLFVLPNAVFLLIAAGTETGWLINVLNTVLLALAAGVCCAYSPAVAETLFTSRSMERHDWLGLGIFLAWFSIVEMRVWSITWRALGMPAHLINSNFTGYGLFVAGCAAVFHLAAPGGVGGRVPTKRWIVIGAWVAFAVFAAMLLLRTVTSADLITHVTALV